VDTTTDPAMGFRNSLMAMAIDPEFIKLNYAQQTEARAQVASAWLSKDPSFMALPETERASNFSKIVLQPPALEDKNLEGAITSAVAKARSGDQDALKQVLQLGAQNGLVAGSGMLTAAMSVNKALGMNPGVPNSLIVGKDSNKLQEYFSSLAQSDPVFAKLNMKVPLPSIQEGKLRFGVSINKGSLLGGALDSIPFMFNPGGVARGIGESAAKGIGKLTGNRVLTDAAKMLLPKTFETLAQGAGAVAQQNALAAARGNPQLYTDTVDKLGATFGTGAVMGFVMSTAVRGAATAASKVGFTAKALLQGPIRGRPLAPSELDGAIAKLAGTRGVPPEILQGLDPSTRDAAWIRNYALEAVQRLSGDGSDMVLRPLDHAVIAGQQAPDFWFAPDDWRNPEGGGFNLWRAVPRKDNKNLESRFVGRAENIGDLQSKLADVLASKYDAVVDAGGTPDMVAAAALVKQGKLQAKNAKAYEPFPEIQKGGYVIPLLRGYLSPTEAQDAAVSAAANGGEAFHINIAATDELKRRFASHDSPLVDGTPLVATPVTPENGNALVILTSVAPKQSVFEATQAAQKMANPSNGLSLMNSRKALLVQQGFDGIVNDDGTVEAFFPSRVKLVIDGVDELTGKLRTTGAPEPTNALGNKIAIQAKIQASMGPNALASSPKALATIMTARLKDVIDPRDVQNLFSQLASAKSIGYNNVKVEPVLGTNNVISKDLASEVIRNPDGSVTIRIPERITGFPDQKEFVTSLVDGIDALGTAQSGKSAYAPLGGKALSKAVEANPTRYVLQFPSEEANVNWLRSIVRSEMNGSDLARTGSGYSLVDPKGNIQKSFPDVYSARDYVVGATVDDRFIRSDLYRQGYMLKGNKDQGYTVTGPGLSKPAIGATIKEVSEAIGYKPAAVSNRIAPHEVKINVENTMATFDGKTLMASPKDVAATLSKFEDPDELASMLGVTHHDNGDVYELAHGLIRVDVPRLGMRRFFSSADEARAFIATDMTSLTNLQDAAEHKGLTLFADHTSGGFRIGDGSNVFEVKTPEEAASVLAKYPDPSGSREILAALDPQADEAIRQVLAGVDPKLMAEWKAADYNAIVRRRSVGQLDTDPSPAKRSAFREKTRGAVRDMLSTYDHYTETVVSHDLGRHELANMRNVLKRSYVAKEKAFEKDSEPLFALFSNSRGKLFKEDRREAIAAYREAGNDPKLLESAKQAYGELSPEEQAALEKLPAFTDALAKRFGVDPSTYRNNYITHVQKWVQGNKAEASKMIDADELLNASYGGADRVPAPARAYFRNERVSDLMTASMERDPLKVFLHYIHQGNKEFYMKQPIQDMADYLNSHKDTIPPDVWGHLAEDLEAFSRYKAPKGQVVAEQFLQGIHEVLHPKNPDPDGGRKMMSNLFALTSLGKLGFRVWPAARQIAQLLQMLAPRVGIEAVGKAMDEIRGPQGRNILQRHYDLGILPPDAPFLGQLHQSKTVRLTRTSMRGIWTTDQIVRGGAARTGENLLDDAIRSWKSGAFKGDTQKFVNYAELSAIQGTSPELVQEIVSKATSGDPLLESTAKQLFAKKLADETGFDFSHPALPHAFRDSFVGKVFGQYGTWSTAYRENMYRGFQNGGAGKKIAFAARFVGVGLGLYAAAQAAGIKGNDFLPGYGGLFGGGPAASFAIDFYRAPGTYREGAAARENIERALSPVVYDESKGDFNWNVPSFLPGTLQYHYAQKMIEAIRQGDYYKAFLAATSAPEAQ
jgi:hypothetical protein